ncbi:sugar transferase [Candidatus Desulfofervidus auxilii]|uniref:Sugar transferase n=1 Tax=Desulfofervidus auxilii TaxID=1621989 RepID=A0A7U4QIX0_DESA2|nr:glycosyltransferase [Candidatus Desulfofervidus auxilii]AMM40200.1 sugar transferase [Candidatus Desulfofervidus auxilii]CAD7770849.1 N-acetyl-alpha-D-glucosaminyl L-malate synthase [Candidatus Methanoperedenaceae archaeon GB50]CAD7771966.1 N-acetyl-alpha-D-glucosaminyl L-malate synthase [Candidatus Methanoperedenaceae archaeon GB37]
MIRVLHTIETHGPGGAESVILTIASKLDHYNFESFGFFIKNGWIVDNFKRKNIQVRVSQNKYYLDVPLLKDLIMYIIKHKINIIHSHEFTMSFYSTLVAKITNIKCVTTIHGNKDYIMEKMTRKLIMKFIAYNSYIVTVSNELKNWLHKTIKIPENKIKLIFNGVDTKKFNNDESKKLLYKKSLCDELKITDKSIIISNVARLYEVKGHKYLIDAASLVLKKYPDVHFMIAGDGPEKHKIQKMIKERKISKNFHLLGERSDIPKILSASDIYVLSSLSEGLSLSILEAMACGLPIIATDVGENSKLIFKNENGYLVPPQNPIALANKIKYLIKNKEKRKNFGIKSRTIVEKKFNQDIMVNKYAELYKKLSY